MSRPVVRVRGLRKEYESLEAVAGIDLTIDRGEVFGLLGPNGAGKTTVVEILEGHRARSGGDVDVLGFDPGLRPRELRERIGIVPQEGGLEPVLTVREVVALYSAAYPRPRPVDEVVELVGLQEKRNARVETLSGGQKRRLDLAVGIAGDPELIFLDEPTTGFDPSARRRAWELVDGLRSLRKTILLTTHYMEEAQRLADRVAVIAAGRIVAEGDPSTLAGREHGLPSSPSAGQTALTSPSCPCRATSTSSRSTAASRSAPGADPRPRAARDLGVRPRRGARRPDDHSPVARGRLPRADRREAP